MQLPGGHLSHVLSAGCRAFGSSLLDTLFPPRCVGCGDLRPSCARTAEHRWRCWSRVFVADVAGRSQIANLKSVLIAGTGSLLSLRSGALSSTQAPLAHWLQASSMGASARWLV